MSKPERVCAGHRHRSYVPIEIHHVWPLGMGGPDEPSNLLPLCSNAHTAVHEYMRIIIKHGYAPPWRLRIKYGRRIRKIAEDGYLRWRTDQIMKRAMGVSDDPQQ